MQDCMAIAPRPDYDNASSSRVQGLQVAVAYVGDDTFILALINFRCSFLIGRMTLKPQIRFT